MKRLFTIAALLVITAPAALAQCGGCRTGGTAACGNAAGIGTLKLTNLAGATVCLCENIGKRPVALLLAGRDSASVRALGLFRSAQNGAEGAVDFVAAFAASPKAVKSLLKPGDSLLSVRIDTGRKAAAALAVKRLPAVAFFNAAGKLVRTEAQVTEEAMTDGISAATAETDEQVDPVCGMTVTKASAAGSYEYKGKTYYFCSKACKDGFVRNPGKYRSQ
jgi:Cu+-exporting ATPase